MKCSMILIMSLLLMVGITGEVYAQNTKKMANLNAQEIKKALEVIEKNKALFSNPELLQKISVLSQSMKKQK